MKDGARTGDSAHRTVPIVVVLITISLLAPFAPFAKGVAPEKGVAVERVDEPGAGASAGVQVGDLLTRWETADRSGSSRNLGGQFKSALDFEDIAIEYGSRGRVKVHGWRRGEQLVFILPVEQWRIAVRPSLGEKEMALYLRGLNAVEGGDLAVASEAWKQLASALRKRRDIRGECWARLGLARVLAKGGDLAGATGQCRLAVEAARPACPECAAQFLEHLCGYAREAGNIESAMSAILEAIKIRRSASASSVLLASDLNRAGSLSAETGGEEEAKAFFAEARQMIDAMAPESLEAALIYSRSGVFAWGGGDMVFAEELMRRSVQIGEKLKTGRRQASKDLYNLASVLLFKGEYDASEEAVRRSMAIQEEIGLKGGEVANSWRGLGAVAQMRGELDQAELYYRESLDILLQFEPESLRTAYTYDNLGTIAWSRGNLDLAGDFMNKSLEIYMRLDSEGVDVAEMYGNMGVLAWYRGDAERARAFYEKSLEMRRKTGQKNPTIADTLTNLGILEKATGNIEKAMGCYLDALSLLKETYPDGPGVATVLTNIGNLKREMTDPRGAEALFKEALGMVQKRAAGSLEESTLLFNLGTLYDEMGDTDRALAMLEKSLQISSRLAPGSADLAETHSGLAIHWAKVGDPQKALASYAAAVDALESQRGKLGGGSGAGETFSGKYADYYRTLAIEQVRAGKGADAFDTIEHFRARALLEMLAERDIDFSKDASPELLREQKSAEQELDSLQSQLASLNPVADAGQIDALLKQIGDAHGVRRAISERIRQASPGLAGLKYPKPVALSGLRAVIPKGTLFLSYCVGKNETCMVASLDNRLEARIVSVDRGLLRRQVVALRAMLSDGQASENSMAALSKRIYAEMLGPVQHLLKCSSAVIICPDGPLHSLPFAALPGDSKKYLLEERAFSFAISATVLAESQIAQGDRHAGTRVVAFGDPACASTGDEGTGKHALGAVAMARHALPLPWTRLEVQAICGLFPESSTELLGADASEAEAKQLDKTSKYVHFACHAFLDDRFPLDSGLALSPPAGPGGGDNGFFQGWEIFEQLRICADLVTLSACETGLGMEMGGEGLIGLTRAFQYAGARSVLSSLWPVSDESTAELMKSFYSHLKLGKPKAEALRLAQLDLIKGVAGSLSKGLSNRGLETAPAKTHPSSSIQHPIYSHPFFWAGFVLNGESK